MEVLTAGAQTTIQDAGRLGLLRYGVGCAGAMDKLAMRCANLWLGNDENAAVLEIPTYPFELRAQGDVCIALAGADNDVWVDDRPLAPWSCFVLRAGQRLRIGSPRLYSRCYLAVQGGFDVPLVLGSRSTQGRGSFGGFEGRGVAPGDRLNVGATASGSHSFGPEPYLGFVPPQSSLPFVHDTGDGICRLRVLPAGEYEDFTAEAQTAFWNAPWKVSVQSNRAGYRLSGERLGFKHVREMRSHGIVPGVIQVPPAGAPIIQLSDAHTAGGYPKMGTVIEADLWRLGQVPLGAQIRFVEVSYDAALDALQDVERYVGALRAAIGTALPAFSKRA